MLKFGDEYEGEIGDRPYDNEKNDADDDERCNDIYLHIPACEGIDRIKNNAEDDSPGNGSKKRAHDPICKIAQQGNEKQNSCR